MPPGFARFSMRLCLAGSAGASHGAAAAVTVRSATRTSPAIARWLCRKRCHASADRLARTAGAALAPIDPTPMATRYPCRAMRGSSAP